jgi:hypothetical protein
MANLIPLIIGFVLCMGTALVLTLWVKPDQPDA